MGSEISSLVIVPIIGTFAIILAVYAILKQNKGKDTAARWLVIGSIATILLLIVINLILTIL